MTSFKKIIITGLIGSLLFFFAFESFGRINNNGAGGGYGEGGEGIAATGTDIDYYITEGAGYYLAANTAVQELLQIVELQDTRGIDTARLDTLLDTAAVNMKNAVAMYERLIAAASVTPYNPTVQTALKNFDYRGFARENNLNAVVFGQVKKFLEKGDITGTLKTTHSRFTRVLAILDSLTGETPTDRLPGVPVLRQLNETFSETSLFGSYTARVFESLLN